MEKFLHEEIGIGLVLASFSRQQKEVFLVKNLKINKKERYFILWGPIETPIEKKSFIEMVSKSERSLSLGTATRKFLEAASSLEFTKFKKIEV